MVNAKSAGGLLFLRTSPQNEVVVIAEMAKLKGNMLVYMIPLS